MVNILSVDFDWIMEPCINLYNGMADDGINLSQNVEELKHIQCVPDYNKFYQISVYIKNIAKTINDNSKIYFCDKHREILDCINDKWKLDIPVHIYNIDHHHDCGYFGDIKKNTENGPGSNNWALMSDKIKKYTWINNKNSETISLNNDIIQHFDVFEQSSDINLINYIKFDYIFVCLSPGWVPTELFPLFDTLQFMIKENGA